MRLAVLAAVSFLVFARSQQVVAGAEPIAADEPVRPGPEVRPPLQIERPPPDLPAVRSLGSSPSGSPTPPSTPATARADRPGTVRHGGADASPGSAVGVVEAALQPMAALPTTPLVPMARARLAEVKSDGTVAYRLEEDERVIVLDLPDLKAQAQRFLRIVLFVERGGAPRHRILSVPEARAWLEDKRETLATLTVGNNMRADDLARFFNTARFQGEPLTVDERRLLDDLKAWRVLRETAQGLAVEVPERIIISVPQVSSVAGCARCTVGAVHRRAILEHELAHALFAIDAVYRDHAVWFWHNVMTEEARRKFLAFLAQRGYDTGNPELVVNEMQAFLMHTPERAMFSATAVGLAEDELEAQRRRFADGLRARPWAPAPAGYRFD